MTGLRDTPDADLAVARFELRGAVAALRDVIERTAEGLVANKARLAAVEAEIERRTAEPRLVEVGKEQSA